MVFIEEITETQYEKALRLKGEGNDAFKRRENTKAKSLYTRAMQTLDDCKADDSSSPPLKATLFSNRCQVYMALDALDSALDDATASVTAAPTWPKAHHRLGSVHMRAGAYTLAFESFRRAAQLDPADVELTNACAKAHEAMAEHGLLPEDANPTGAPAPEQEEPNKEADEEKEAEPNEEKAAAISKDEEPAAKEPAAEPQVPPSSATAEEPRGLATPRYEVALTEASSNETGVPECVVTVWLPLVDAMSQLDVEVSSGRLHLKAAGLYELTVVFSQPVCDTKAKARFAGKGARKGTFTMRVPLAA